MKITSVTEIAGSLPVVGAFAAIIPVGVKKCARIVAQCWHIFVQNGGLFLLTWGAGYWLYKQYIEVLKADATIIHDQLKSLQQQMVEIQNNQIEFSNKLIEILTPSLNNLHKQQETQAEFMANILNNQIEFFKESMNFASKYQNMFKLIIEMIKELAECKTMNAINKEIFLVEKFKNLQSILEQIEYKVLNKNSKLFASTDGTEETTPIPIRKNDTS